MHNAKSTAVDATARISDLISEIDQFWIEVTGEGLPEDQIEELMEMHPDDLLAKLQGLKMTDAPNYVPQGWKVES